MRMFSVVGHPKCIITKIDIIMSERESCLGIIVSTYGFQDHYKENRFLVNGIAELDSMIVTENYDCSKMLCIHIDEPIPKNQVELALYRFADKLNNAGAIGAYHLIPMGVPLIIDGVDFFDMLSEGDTIKQFRYYIDYVSVKL